VARPEPDPFSAPGHPVPQSSDRRERRLTDVVWALNSRTAETYSPRSPEAVLNRRGPSA